ncbi:MAG TPA: DUF2231 domain-containing protein [Chitinispirillaceae bacterium]|nr:DUF2231 domain-containing protein [Chitinispirillaceae bacterium]
MEQSIHCGVRSSAAIAGHPVHPIFITFPIAFFTGVLATDIIYLATKNMFWSKMSFYLLIFGLIGSVISAISGLVEFLSLRNVRQYRIGWAHAIGNVLAVSIAAVNFAIRINPAMPVYLVLSAVTVLILGFTGWWGGELSYKLGIGVDMNTRVKT